MKSRVDASRLAGGVKIGRGGDVVRDSGGDVVRGGGNEGSRFPNYFS